MSKSKEDKNKKRKRSGTEYNEYGVTIKEERYVQELLKGKTQREAFMTAFPHTRKWKDNSIDSVASTTLKKEKVKQRYDNLTRQMQEHEQKKTLWTREEAIETLKYVIQSNKEDIERMENAHEGELILIADMMVAAKTKKESDKLLREYLKQKKQRRRTNVHNKGIIDSVAELNKMQGFNEENINLTGSVIFSGEDELED